MTAEVGRPAPPSAPIPPTLPAEAKVSAPLALPVAPIASIALSEEHAKMLSLSLTDGRPATPPELHAQLATQPKDPAWSFGMEQSIRQSLAAGNASAEFDIVSVECRESLCEVLAFGNLPTSGERWSQVWGEMSKQAQYTGVSVSAAAFAAQNGRHTFATFVQRSKP